MKKSVKTSLLAGTVSLGLLFTACSNSQSKQSDMNHHQDSHSDSIYTCPMHPEVTGEKGKKCPKCGMDLVLVSNENSGKTEVKLTTEPQSIKAGIPVKFTFAFKDNGNTIPLEISHEMKLHLMAVDENLSWFRHIHPKEQTDGSYTITETFPNGGKYILFSDFKPKNGTPIVDKKEILVKGKDAKEISFEDKFVAEVDGYTITLENGSDFKTHRTQALEINVEKEGKRLTEDDIEPYLGATAHIAMISKKDKEFLHIHPNSNDSFSIYAESHIEKAGIYRIWVEFQTNGKVHTATFTVNVMENIKASHDHMGHQH